ncbi:hypothetical protein K458DRAFT_129412 [Lentithecium fluviatile CBS 122367]|uniref:Uncharacterized protein n=1 Tax=Lentithecium fluviatile CBS 122367 TaxID=1168545 RepID=A0A6G1JG77_9PLEO|nr:hypothetical protein K458DRAFT_129412 [Lentithecium fluviatile CBS 122367]
MICSLVRSRPHPCTLPMRHPQTGRRLRHRSPDLFPFASTLGVLMRRHSRRSSRQTPGRLHLLQQVASWANLLYAANDASGSQMPL